MNTALKNKKFMWFLSAFLIISIGIAIINAGIFIKEKSGICLVVDSAVSENGQISYLRYNEGQAPEVRKISADGRLLDSYKLKSNNSNIYYAYRHITNYGDKVFFYEYEIDSITYLGKSERIKYYDFSKDEDVTVYQRSFDDNEDIENLNILSIDIHDNYLYFTSQTDEGNILTVDRINLMDNSVEAYRTVYLGQEMEISEAYYAQNGNIFFTMPNSQIYTIQNDRIYKIFQPDDFCAITSFSVSPDGSIYFILYEPEGNSIYKNATDYQSFEKLRDIDSDIVDIRFFSDEDWIAVNFDGLFLVSDRDGENIIEALKIPYKFLISAEFLLPFISESILAFIMLRFIYMYMTRARITIFQKQLLFSLPVFAVGLYIILTFSYNSVYKLIEDKTYEKLQLDAEERLKIIDTELFAGIDWANPYEDEDFQYLRNQGFEMSKYRSFTLYDMRNPEIQPKNTGAFINYWFYWVKDGESAYIASCDYRYINLPSDYMQEPRSRQATRFALKENQTVYNKVYDIAGEGTWLAITMPLHDADGNIVGLVEVSCTTTMLEYQVMENVRGIMLLTGGIFVLLLTIFMIILLIMLKSLRNLKQAALELINGNYGYTVQCNSRDEVFDIAVAFNDMSLKTMEKINDLELINRGYFRFIPSAIFEILHKNKIQDVSLGDQRNVETTVMTMDTSGLDSFINNISNDEFISYINVFYSYMIPIVDKGGGVIERYSEAGLVSLFTEEPLQPLNAAISMQKALRSFNAGELRPNGKPVDMVITLNLCDVLVGIIGNENRLSTTLVSEQIAFAHRLEAIGKKFGINILATDSLHSKLSEFSGINYRLFGYACFRGAVVPVYDFFDGDDYELLYCKKNTLEEFEAAVKLYKNGRFYEAKNKFIEVIKLSPYDLASREYLVRCDSNLRDNSVTPEKIYLLEF